MSKKRPFAKPARVDLRSKRDAGVVRPGLRERLTTLFSTPEWQRRKRIAAVLLVIWMAGAAFPPAPPPAGAELDQNWVLGLNMAQAQHLAPGREIIWTYGPLGALSQPDPAGGRVWWPLVYRLGMYGLWVAALVRLRRRPWIVLVFGLAALLDPFLASDHLESALYAFTLLALIDDGWPRKVELGILGFLAGVALLGKVSLGIQALAMLAGVGFAIQWREKRGFAEVGAAFLLAAATVVGLYWASTGDIASLPLYFRNTLELMAGYSESMAMPGPTWQVVLALLAVGALAIGIPAMAKDRRELLPVMPLAALCAFFIFKNSMVRQEPAHFVSLAPKLAMAALFLTARTLPNGRGSDGRGSDAKSRSVTEAIREWLLLGLRPVRSVAALQVACLVFGCCFLAQGKPESWGAIEQRLLFEQTFSWTEVFLHWPQNWRNLALEGKANLSAAKVSPIYRAEVGTASITSIPWDVSEERANGWTWRPQPVFQSYAAYTPRLDRIDAEHVDGKTAADFLFVSWKAIDGRHPFLEEPLTWQERLNHYQVDLHDRQHILLKRSAAPRLAPESKMSGEAAVITWNQDVPVPQKPGTIVHLSIGKSVWGSLRAFVYRLDPVWMEVRRQSGREERWRMMRANMENGVLIRDLPASLQDVALLAQTGCQISDPVVSFRLRAGHPADYRSAIRVEWGQRATEARACTQLTETQAAFGVRGGADEVTVHGGGGRQIPVTADVPWVKAEAGDTGVKYSVEENLSGGARGGSIAISGLKLRIFQQGIPSWSGVFRPMDTLGLFALGIDESVHVFGRAGDQPVAGDWTGSGVTRIGVFRDGVWYLDVNNNGKWDGPEGGDALYYFGLRGDRPVTGDWNGDGTTKVGVYREGQWVLDYTGQHKFDPRPSNIRKFHFGLKTDIPVVSNWGHAGRADHAGVFRDGLWYVDVNGDGKYDPKDDGLYPFGLPGDIPVVVNWGGGKKIGVYRGGLWILDRNGNNRYDADDVVFKNGRPGDIPLTGQWK